MWIARDRENCFGSGRHSMIPWGRQVGARNGARRRWAVVALVAVLLIVGHDLLMTGDAHAAAGPPHRSAASAPDHLGAAAAFRHASSAADGSEASAAATLGACGTNATATWRRIDLGFDDAGGGALAGASRRLDTLLAIKTSAPPPTLSPRARRALLQVFRI